MEGPEEERDLPSPSALRPLADIEELVTCCYCDLLYNEAKRLPKLLSCKHVYCLECAHKYTSESGEVLCVLCWKRTGLPLGRADALPTHAALLALARRVARSENPARWCRLCGIDPTLVCAEHAPSVNALRSHSAVARDTLLLRTELRRLSGRQRDFQLQALDAVTALKMQLEAELAVPAPIEPPPPVIATPPSPLSTAALPAAVAELKQLRMRRASSVLQNRLDELVNSANTLLDYEQMRRALVGLSHPETPPLPSTPSVANDPLLFLANYCMAQIYTRAYLLPPTCCKKIGPQLLRMPPSYPLFYFNLEVSGIPVGRIVIEVRNDLAPRMARNFDLLVTGECGFGYRGCTIFQCWEHESVITGDFELNNGRGGRSVFEEALFLPDDTKMAAMRGSVGMRRSKKRHDQYGLVGSQFRIILCETRSFTAIFGFVVEGLELVDQLSCTGDSSGKPQSTILIASCGKLD